MDENEYLLNRSKLEGVDNKNLKSGLKENLLFSENKKILNIYPFYLQAWNFGKDGRDTNRIRIFVRDKIGEKPNILDSVKLEANADQLELYLFNNGYFNAKVDYAVKTRHKKAFVTYKVNLNKPYRIAEVEYRIYDRDIHKLLMKAEKLSIPIGWEKSATALQPTLEITDISSSTSSISLSMSTRIKTIIR